MINFQWSMLIDGYNPYLNIDPDSYRESIKHYAKCDNIIPVATAAFKDSAFPFPGIVI